MAIRKKEHSRPGFLCRFFLSLCVIGYHRSISALFYTNHTAYAPIDTSFLEKMRLNAIFE